MLGLTVVLGGLIGYLFGVAKDRSSSIAAKRLFLMKGNASVYNRSCKVT